MPHLVSEDSVAGRLISGCATVWRDYGEHAFVEQLADGTLPQACFRRYLVQDYRFLLHFARAWALAAFKSDDIAQVRACAATVDALINEEMRLHVRVCSAFGVDERALAEVEDAPETLAYTSFVIERGVAGDLADLLVALAPCVIGYGEIGARLVRYNPGIDAYADWISTYSGDAYRGVALAASAQLDQVVGERLGSDPVTSPRWPFLQRTFAQATQLEIAFWEMGLAAAGAAS